MVQLYLSGDTYLCPCRRRAGDKPYGLKWIAAFRFGRLLVLALAVAHIPTDILEGLTGLAFKFYQVE